MRGAAAFFAMCIAGYLFGAFVHWALNPSDWWLFTRLVIAVVAPFIGWIAAIVVTQP